MSMGISIQDSGILACSPPPGFSRSVALALCLLGAATLGFAQRADAFAGVIDASVRLPVSTETPGDRTCAEPPVAPRTVLLILGGEADKHIGRWVVPPDPELLPSDPANELVRLSRVSAGSARCATLCVMGLDAPSLDLAACIRNPNDGQQQCRKTDGAFDRIGTSEVLAFSRAPVGKGMLICATGKSWRADGDLVFSLAVRW